MRTKRFNTPYYKRRIQAIRHYKRDIAVEPQTGLEKFLRFIGLGTLWRRTIAVLAVGIFIYLAYFAKFLVIIKPSVYGTDPVGAEQINSVFQDYKKKFIFGLPQKNIFFFDQNRFKSYLLARDLQVSSVTSINKKFWHDLSITVVPRVPAYLFKNKETYFVLNSDGSISAIADQYARSKYITITDTADEQIALGEIIFDSRKSQFLSYMCENLPKKLSIAIQAYEISGKSSNDLVVLFKEGARLYFDNTADPKKSLERLFILWVSLSAEQQKKLAYIDLRFEPKAYVCYKTDKCAQPPAPAQPAIQQQGKPASGEKDSKKTSPENSSGQSGKKIRPKK